MVVKAANCCQNPVGAVQDVTGGVVWVTALEDGMAVEVLVGENSGVELRVLLVANFSNRGGCRSMRHAFSPFQTGDLDGFVGGLAPWKRASEAQGSGFSLTVAHLLHRR